MMFHQFIKNAVNRTAITLATVFTLTCGIAFAQEEGESKAPSEMTIAEIMNVAHKKPEDGDTSLLKRVATPQSGATEDEKKLLLELYKSMAAQAPPKGDATEWKERNELLISATEAVIKGEEGSHGMLKKASSCAKCHKAHKGD